MASGVIRDFGGRPTGVLLLGISHLSFRDLGLDFASQPPIAAPGGAIPSTQQIARRIWTIGADTQLPWLGVRQFGEPVR